MIKTNINFMKGRKYAYIFSGFCLLVCLLSIFVLRGFNQGIDFTGGLTANLTVNFEESNIGMMRDIFSKVELHQVATGESSSDLVRQAIARDARIAASNAAAVSTNLAEKAAASNAAPLADKATVIVENLGRNITRLDKKAGDATNRVSETYLIRIKNIPGVDKDEIERALTGELNKQFKQRTVVSVSIVSRDAADDGLALAALLKPFGMDGEIKGMTMTVRDQGKTNTVKIFDVAKEFTSAVNETEIRNGLTKLFLAQPQYDISRAVDFASTIEWGSFNSVSSNIGKELQESAIWLSIACVLIMLFYIAIRFDFKFGVGAIVGLIHDMIIMLGVISITGNELNVPVIAAVLTIFGYSINDTIVVFDRIRESLKFSRKEDLPGIVNRSINETLSRTIITSGTTLFAAVSIYLFAGDVLRDFAFSLIVGIVFGTYSSVFISSPVYLAMEKMMDKKVRESGSKA
jgi:preprotein translocase subunit SecF